MTKEEWEASIERVGVAAACLIFKENKYLLVQEAQQKVYGLWNFPAGHVDKGESLSAAAIREAKEETGYEVKLGQEIAVIHESLEKPVVHVFSASITGGELKAQEDEILDVSWLSFREMEQLNAEGKFRRPWIWDVIKKHHLTSTSSSSST